MSEKPALSVIMFATNDLRSETRGMKEAAALANAGFRVTLVGLSRPGLPDIERADSYEIRRIAEARATSWRWPVDKVMAVRNRRAQLRQLLVNKRPDIVHAINADGLAAAIFACRGMEIRVVYDAFEIFDEMLKGVGRSPLSWLYWRWIERSAARRVDLAITVSDALANVLGERLGIPFEVIHNVPPLVPLGNPGRLRRELNLDNNSRIVLYQGGLTQSRGLVRLVGAMAQVPDSVLVVQGDGPERASMEAEAVGKGLDERVVFMGHLPMEALHSYARDADVGVVIYEATDLNNLSASPNKLFSYMMAALPMVASDFPGLRRFVVDERLGRVFDPADSDSIATAIREVLSSGERAEMGERGRLLAEKRYNWDTESKRLVYLYQSMSQNPKHERRRAQ